MLRRNLENFLGRGLTDVAVSSSSRVPAVGHYVRTEGQSLVNALDGSLELLEERRPLGTIGAAAALAGRADAVVTINADILTSLDLASLLQWHTERGAAMTLAVHTHAYRPPFGVVRVSGDRVLAYEEKPIRRELICSAICVLGPKALYSIPADGLNLNELAERLIASGQHVAAYPHEVPWIDVNDAIAITAAEELYTAHAAELDQFSHSPATRVVAVGVAGSDGILLRRHGNATRISLDAAPQHVERRRIQC